jgi:hypothetical protein
MQSPKDDCHSVYGRLYSLPRPAPPHNPQLLPDSRDLIRESYRLQPHLHLHRHHHLIRLHHDSNSREYPPLPPGWYSTNTYLNIPYIQYLSTTTLTTTTTTTELPFPWSPIPTITYYTTTTTTTTLSSYYLAHTAIPTTHLCSPDATPTVTHHIRCATSNLISERDDRGVAIRWVPEKRVIPLTSRFNSDLLADATRDPIVCCQLCVDNRECAASEWKRDWGDGCRLYYYFGGGGGGENDTLATCGGEELEYYGDENRWPGQGSLVQVGCGRLRYRGVVDG